MLNDDKKELRNEINGLIAALKQSEEISTILGGNSKGSADKVTG